MEDKTENRNETNIVGGQKKEKRSKIRDKSPGEHQYAERRKKVGTKRERWEMKEVYS